MAPGPDPKHPSRVSRRNRSSTSSQLVANPDLVVPPLPDEDSREWLPITRAWWRDIWASPMAPEYDASDVHGLFIVAQLVDDFWRKPSKELAAEIRLQRQSFGLSPIDRRRLQWEIEHADEASAAGDERRRAAAMARAQARPTVDPRNALHAV